MPFFFCHSVLYGFGKFGLLNFFFLALSYKRLRSLGINEDAQNDFCVDDTTSVGDFSRLTRIDSRAESMWLNLDSVRTLRAKSSFSCASSHFPICA